MVHCQTHQLRFGVLESQDPFPTRIWIWPIRKTPTTCSLYFKAPHRATAQKNFFLPSQELISTKLVQLFLLPYCGTLFLAQSGTATLLLLSRVGFVATCYHSDLSFRPNLYYVLYYVIINISTECLPFAYTFYIFVAINVCGNG